MILSHGRSSITHFSNIGHADLITDFLQRSFPAWQIAPDSYQLVVACKAIIPLDTIISRVPSLHSSSFTMMDDDNDGDDSLILNKYKFRVDDTASMAFSGAKK